MEIQNKIVMVSFMLLLSACGKTIIKTQTLDYTPTTSYGHSIALLVSNIISNKKLTYSDKATNDVHDEYRRYRFTVSPAVIKSTVNDVNVLQDRLLIDDLMQKIMLYSGKVEIYQEKSAYWDYKLQCTITDVKHNAEPSRINNNNHLKNRKVNNKILSKYELLCDIFDRKKNLTYRVSNYKIN